MVLHKPNSMDTGIPPLHRYPTRWKLHYHNSLSQEPRVNNKACKRKRNRRTRVIDLPRELIFNILLFLPAKLLQEVVRYVCKQWYDIVSEPSFIRAHCQMPTTTSASFILQSYREREKVYYFDKDVTKISFPLPVWILNSCNGLVLLCDNFLDQQKLYLANPLRKLIVSLPLVVPVVMEGPSYTSYSFAVNSSGQYKMVHLAVYPLSGICEMGVFTIGFDKAWRRIDLRHLLGIPLRNVVNKLLHPSLRHGLLIAGFLYWRSASTHFLAMDVDTETFYLISMPTGEGRYIHRNEFISMETALGLITEDDCKIGMWKLLKLTDVKSSEWTEIAMIDIRAMLRKVGRKYYVNWYTNSFSLIDGEFVFSFSAGSYSTWMIRYNLANESFVSFEFKSLFDTPSCMHHVPTYVSPKNVTLNSFKT